MIVQVEERSCCVIFPPKCKVDKKENKQITNQEVKDILKNQIKYQVGKHHVKLSNQNGNLSMKIARNIRNYNLFDKLKSSQVQKSICEQKYSILKHILKLHEQPRYVYRGRFVPLQLLISKNVNLK